MSEGVPTMGKIVVINASLPLDRVEGFVAYYTSKGLQVIPYREK